MKMDLLKLKKKGKNKIYYIFIFNTSSIYLLIPTLLFNYLVLLFEKGGYLS